MLTGVVIACFIAALGIVKFYCEKYNVRSSIRTILLWAIAILGAVSSISTLIDIDNLSIYFTKEIEQVNARVDRVQNDITGIKTAYVNTERSAQRTTSTNILNKLSQKEKHDSYYAKFVNKTNENAYLVMAAYDYDKNDWISEGWYLIEPYKEIIQKLPVDQDGQAYNEFYYYVQHSNGNYWGGKEGIIIDPDHAFEIENGKTDLSRMGQYKYVPRFKRQLLNQNNNCEIILTEASPYYYKEGNYVKFTNKTSDKIYLALAFYDYSKAGWVSVGWFCIEPNKYFFKKLPENQYSQANSLFYYYAENGNNESWSGETGFIIDRQHAFTITNADKQSSLKSEYYVFSKFLEGTLNEDGTCEIEFAD